MKQVYLFDTRDDDDGVPIVIFSSKQKAISHCNREFDKPDFQFDRNSGITLVSVDGATVGWITKKIVQ